jgi:Ran GTPase-activating protein (RanGAP) involved in mRNA processing and transport
MFSWNTESPLPAAKVVVTPTAVSSPNRRTTTATSTDTSYIQGHTELILSNKSIGSVGAKALAVELKGNRSLRQLRLTSSCVGDEGTTAIALALAENTTLTKLDLSWNNIGDEGVTAIAEVLKEQSTLSELVLSGNKVGPVGARTISDALMVNTTLRELNFHCNNLGDDGASVLATALKENKSLYLLDLCYNNIGPVGATPLFNVLRQANTTLTMLELGRNNIPADLLSSISELIRANAAGLRASCFPIVAKEPRRAAQQRPRPVESRQAGALLPNTPLPAVKSVPASFAMHEFRQSQTLLDLSGRAIGDDTARLLAKQLMGNTCLKELRLSSNCIGDAGAEMIANVLKENATLVKLMLDSNSIGTSGIAAIADSLKQNKRLTGLVLRNNNFGAVGAAAIASALEDNTSLEELGLGGNSVGAVGAAALGVALRRNSTLASLGLGASAIRDAGAAAIAGALKENAALSALGLGGNFIGCAGAIAIADSLKVNTTLTGLFLQANVIGTEGATAISTALKDCRTLTKLVLDGNQIAPQILAVIKGQLRANLNTRRPTQKAGTKSVPHAAERRLHISTDEKEPLGQLGSPKQRAELEFELRRLNKVCEACKDTIDEDDWKKGIHAERKVLAIQKLIQSGKYPSSGELKAKVADVTRAIQDKVERKLLSTAMPLRERLAILKEELERELEAERRIYEAEGNSTSSESIEEDRKSVLAALQASDPTDEVGPVSMNYLSLITNGWRDKIGSGGFGIVYKGEDAQNGVVVAIKTIPNDRLHENEKRKFKREIEV